MIGHGREQRNSAPGISECQLLCLCLARLGLQGLIRVGVREMWWEG